MIPPQVLSFLGPPFLPMLVFSDRSVSSASILHSGPQQIRFIPSLSVISSQSTSWWGSNASKCLFFRTGSGPNMPQNSQKRKKNQKGRTIARCRATKDEDEMRTRAAIDPEQEQGDGVVGQKHPNRLRIRLVPIEQQKQIRRQMKNQGQCQPQQQKQHYQQHQEQHQQQQQQQQPQPKQFQQHILRQQQKQFPPSNFSQQDERPSNDFIHASRLFNRAKRDKMKALDGIRDANHAHSDLASLRDFSVFHANRDIDIDDDNHHSHSEHDSHDISVAMNRPAVGAVETFLHRTRRRSLPRLHRHFMKTWCRLNGCTFYTRARMRSQRRFPQPWICRCVVRGHGYVWCIDAQHTSKLGAVDEAINQMYRMLIARENFVDWGNVSFSEGLDMDIEMGKQWDER